MNDPELYTTANDLQRRSARDFSDEFSNEFGKMSGRCLDIGSGPGDVAVDVILPKLNTQASLVCSDFSEVMLKFAEEKYKGNSRLSFIMLDIETPGLPKHLVEQFDHVTSFYCLHWCQDMRFYWPLLRKANCLAMNKPALYSTINHLQRRDTNDFTEEYGEEIGQMSGRCLDVGSGPGDVAVDVILSKLNKNANLVCSDISEEMLKFAEKKYKDNRRVSFIKLDIETPDLPKDLVGQFDHVISCWCLHWCQDMRQTFENIFNLLRPGGSSFLMFLANCPGMNSYKKLEAMSRYQPYMKNAERYTPLFQHSLEPRKTLKALIEDVGFEVHHCSVREKNYTFDSPNTLREFLLPINPFLDRIPANLAEEYKKDLVNEFAGLSIIFNKNNRNEDDYSVLCIYKSFVVYLKKPLTK